MIDRAFDPITYFLHWLESSDEDWEAQKKRCNLLHTNNKIKILNERIKRELGED